MDSLVTYVDPWGTLVFSVRPGTCQSHSVVNITVPQPLSYVAASSGGRVTVDRIAGSMTASAGGNILATELTATGPVSVSSSSGSSISVARGHTPFLSAST